MLCPNSTLTALSCCCCCCCCVLFLFQVGYSSDDINKFLWMVRISGGIFPEVVEADYMNSGGQYRVDSSISPRMVNSLMYKMCYYRAEHTTNRRNQRCRGVLALLFFSRRHTPSLLCPSAVLTVSPSLRSRSFPLCVCVPACVRVSVHSLPVSVKFRSTTVVPPVTTWCAAVRSATRMSNSLTSRRRSLRSTGWSERGIPPMHCSRYCCSCVICPALPCAIVRCSPLCAVCCCRCCQVRIYRVKNEKTHPNFQEKLARKGK